jgi:RHS repeat-associated protein
MTESNGLYYMRLRYYSPELKRFINADVLKGAISSSETLNQYAYANGNPVSMIDPFGTSAEPSNSTSTVATVGHTVLDVAGMVPIVYSWYTSRHCQYSMVFC